MDFGLRGRVALVAASSKGLGRAIAEQFAQEGARLVLCARNPEPLAAAASAVRAYGAEVETVVADLAADGAQLVANRAIERFGQVDVLVTNAGGPPPGPFEAHDREAWRSAVRLNLESAIELIRHTLPGMKERRWGRIINVTSIAVKQPVESLILSNSVRSALTGMARTLANEVGPYGITVNNVLPGYTRTERLDELARSIATRDGITEQQAVERWQAQIPMRRLGEPHEFAAVVTFLASNQASYVTGTSITVDGGWVKSLL